MRTVLTAERLWDGASLLNHPMVEVEGGRIASIRAREAREAPVEARVLDYPGATLAPAFLDVHTHGAAGHDVMEATPEALDAIGRFLASHGTGELLPTTVTGPLDTTLHALSGLARLMKCRVLPDGRGPSASTWKGRFCRTQSAAFTRRSTCSSQMWPSLTGSLKPPRGISA